MVNCSVLFFVEPKYPGEAKQNTHTHTKEVQMSKNETCTKKKPNHLSKKFNYRSSILACPGEYKGDDGKPSQST